MGCCAPNQQGSRLFTRLTIQPYFDVVYGSQDEKQEKNPPANGSNQSRSL